MNKSKYLLVFPLIVLMIHLIFSFFSYSSFAQPEPEDTATLPNENISLGPLRPLQQVVAPFLKGLSALVGGIFGLYFILILVRIYYERKNFRVLTGIRSELVHLNHHFTSQMKTTLHRKKEEYEEKN